MNNSSAQVLLNKILATADTMTWAELETIRKEMKYSSVGTDYDHNQNPVPSFWGELNERHNPVQPPGVNIWAKFDILDEETYYMWNNFISRIEELTNDVWRRAHAHKSR